MKFHFLLVALTVGAAMGQSLNCDLHEYKPLDGLKAEMRNGVLELSWQGARSQELRAAFAIRDGQPTIAELAARKAAGPWINLGKNLTPELEVTSGKRRLSEQQMAPWASNSLPTWWSARLSRCARRYEQLVERREIHDRGRRHLHEVPGR